NVKRKRTQVLFCALYVNCVTLVWAT
ncbi:glycerol-3-phosphate O-acyltransferase, partial [Vibrio parahaemolyticus VP2007-007]